MIEIIKNIIEGMGLTFNYGNPSQINYYLHNTDYSQSADNITAFCYLLTDANYENGKTRATIAVFFSKLMDFDFDGSQAIAVQKACEDKAKEFLTIVSHGNVLRYSDARFQYGYNDFAENVGWCAVRAVYEIGADCLQFSSKRPKISIRVVDVNKEFVIAEIYASESNASLTSISYDDANANYTIINVKFGDEDTIWMVRITNPEDNGKHSVFAIINGWITNVEQFMI